jgi:hypothetical protein
MLKKVLWAILVVLVGLLLFLMGCKRGGSLLQYLGGLLIAVGVFWADFVKSDKK